MEVPVIESREAVQHSYVLQIRKKLPQHERKDVDKAETWCLLRLGKVDGASLREAASDSMNCTRCTG